MDGLTLRWAAYKGKGGRVPPHVYSYPNLAMELGRKAAAVSACCR